MKPITYLFKSSKAHIVANFILAAPFALMAPNAQAAPAKFVPYNDFIENVNGASSADVIGIGANKVQDHFAFEAMRQHILTLYQGVEVSHSFVRDFDHIDCVPVWQQPAIKKWGIKQLAMPPQISSLSQSPDSNSHLSPSSPIDAGLPDDEFGNKTECEDNTIPMRRLTLDNLSPFGTLQKFFKKSPNEHGPGLTAAPATATDGHKYSTVYQNVNNYGGNASNNIWSPHINTALGEVFSLSQQWYSGGTGTTLPGLQTLEVGWQVFPALYGGTNARLFIYSTADGYNHTGCYNLTCANFIQTNSSVTFGAGFPSYSVLGGAQHDFSAKYQFFQGNWWLAIGGTWIGYYPGNYFKGGQLTHYATNLSAGTESVGTTVWPNEGSGQWPSTGWTKAAYQRNMYYLPATGGGPIWDTLTANITSPSCYKINGPFYSSTAGWGYYFYEGGPGGSGC